MLSSHRFQRRRLQVPPDQIALIVRAEPFGGRAVLEEHRFWHTQVESRTTSKTGPQRGEQPGPVLLLLLAAGLVQSSFFPRFIFRGLELLGAEHGYRWARPVVLLRLSGASKGCPTAAGGQVLCIFDVCAACGARAAAYEALFVQRRAAAKALFCKSHSPGTRCSSRRRL
jgi:hypothetical protein